MREPSEAVKRLKSTPEGKAFFESVKAKTGYDKSPTSLQDLIGACFEAYDEVHGIKRPKPAK